MRRHHVAAFGLGVRCGAFRGSIKHVVQSSRLIVIQSDPGILPQAGTFRQAAQAAETLRICHSLKR
jgi:hypothetical protein